MIASFLRVQMEELEDYLKDSELFEKRYFHDDINSDPNYIDIDKAWDGIIFLLTGESSMLTTSDLSQIIHGNKILDSEQNFGLGPANYLDANDVKSFSERLSKFKIEDLKANYNAEAMTGFVYPEVWEDDSSLDYLCDYWLKLKEFYKNAANENQAIISIMG